MHSRFGAGEPVVDGAANAVNGCLLGDVATICRRHVGQRYRKNAGKADVVDKSHIDAKSASAEHGTGGRERNDGQW